MDGNKKKGIVYLAFGYEYLLMAAHSAETARQSNPGIICELITNLSFDEDRVDERYRFDRVTFLESESQENRYVKTSIVNYTDLEYAVYVDCDTEILGSLDPAFTFLDDFDLGIKHCSKPTRKEYEVAPGIPAQVFPEWNGGVVFFRNNRRTQRFFRDWCGIFRSEKKNRDQPALARAVFHSRWGGRLLSLNSVWNTLPGDVRSLQNGLRDSRIFHYRKPERWPAVVPGIYSAHESFSKIVDASEASAMNEIEEVEKRYRFLGSPLYRLAGGHRRTRNAFESCVSVMTRLGLVSEFRIERNHRVSGECYEVRGKEKKNVLREPDPAAKHISSSRVELTSASCAKRGSPGALEAGDET